MKKLFIFYWVALVVGCVIHAVMRENNHFDGVGISFFFLNDGLLVGAFFIGLFKIFRVIKKVNPPTWLNLSFWLASFGLFLVNGVWLSGLETNCYVGSCYTYAPNAMAVFIGLLLWAVVSGSWILFNRFVK